jgi:hypothetical protein
MVLDSIVRPALRVGDVGANGLAVTPAHVLGEVGGQRQHPLGTAIFPATPLADREVLADHAAGGRCREPNAE